MEPSRFARVILRYSLGIVSTSSLAPPVLRGASAQGRRYHMEPSRFERVIFDNHSASFQLALSFHFQRTIPEGGHRAMVHELEWGGAVFLSG